MTPTLDRPITIDSTKLNEAIGSIHDALIGRGEDVRSILVDEHRRLVRTIVNFTPPLPKAGAQWHGEQAVRKDLYSLISEASPSLIDTLGSKYGLSNIRTTISAASGFAGDSTGNKIAVNWDDIDPSGNRLQELHWKYRDRKGHVPRRRTVKGFWDARVVVPKGAREPYVNLVQSHVGRWKAKWALSAQQLGDRFPSWISRHFGQVRNQSIFNGTLSGDRPSITFGGRGPDFARDRIKIKAAMDFRAKAIMRRVKLVLSGYNKDLAQGMKARSHAHENNEPYEEVD